MGGFRYRFPEVITGFPSAVSAEDEEARRTSRMHGTVEAPARDLGVGSG